MVHTQSLKKRVSLGPTGRGNQPGVGVMQLSWETTRVCSWFLQRSPEINQPRRLLGGVSLPGPVAQGQTPRSLWCSCDLAVVVFIFSFSLSFLILLLHPPGRKDCRQEEEQEGKMGVPDPVEKLTQNLGGTWALAPHLLHCEEFIE